MLKQEAIDALTKSSLRVKSFKFTRGMVTKEVVKGQEGQFIHKWEPGERLYMIVEFEGPEK